MAEFVREVTGEKNTTYYIAPHSEKTITDIRAVARTNKAKPEIYVAAFMDKGEGRTNKLLEVIVMKIMNEKRDVFADKLKELAAGDFTTDVERKVERKKPQREEDTGSEWLNKALGRGR